MCRALKLRHNEVHVTSKRVGGGFGGKVGWFGVGGGGRFWGQREADLGRRRGDRTCRANPDTVLMQFDVGCVSGGCCAEAVLRLWRAVCCRRQLLCGMLLRLQWRRTSSGGRCVMHLDWV